MNPQIYLIKVILLPISSFEHRWITFQYSGRVEMQSHDLIIITTHSLSFLTTAHASCMYTFAISSRKVSLCFPCLVHTSCHVFTRCIKLILRIIFYLLLNAEEEKDSLYQASERYWPSGMLIHRQNLYAPSSKRWTGRREAQSHGTGQQSKNPLCIYIF
jgi:hypothetical protein